MIENKDKNLNLFRAEIDKIDGDIIKLLKQRMQVITRVAEFKKKSGEKFFIKSAREADMIKNLTKECENFFPSSAIKKIWRAIITSANLLEQPIAAFLYNPQNVADFKYLLREYYLDNLPIFEFSNFEEMLKASEEKSAPIFAFGALQDWWINFAENKNLKIFAKIGENSAHELFLAAAKQQEKSSADNSLLVVEINDKNILQSLKIPAKILAQKNNKYLIELDGFYVQGDEALKEIYQNCAYVAVIGNYSK